MDASVGFIADYTHALRFEDLPADVVRLAKRSVIDTFGLAIGAFNAEPSRIARAMAERASVRDGARVIGTAHRTLPELAAFANGVMGRYLDGNDCFLGAGHPSDAIAAVLAVADTRHADGRSIITAIAAAYEVHYNLCKAVSVLAKGVDSTFYIVVAGAVGAAKILGLDRARIVETLALAVAPNIPLDTTRYGQLSMWKGCAAGAAVRNSVFAALLAQAGMTGPEKPIEGNHGIQNFVGKFELKPFGGNGRPYGIHEVTLKRFCTVAHSLSPITVALELSRLVAVEDIEKVTVYTYRFAWEINGREPEKWRPTTREAADHSLPYIVAAVLIDRGFDDEIFSDERLRDPRIRALIDKIECKEDPEITRRYPQQMPCRIEITTKSGERKIAQIDYPRGHDKNPMSDEEVSEKFRGFVQRALRSARVDQALQALWQLESASDLDEIFEALKIKA
ncbi:MAG: MmgE/PrpD family protein [Betaproteobacteria bacterium]|nr:MmgE/PrpD family protein [Betaproteobacteria bacterium]